MTIPIGTPVIDLMVGVPSDGRSWEELYRGLTPGQIDVSRDSTDYLFRDRPTVSSTDYETYLLEEMDRYNIARALIPVSADEPIGRRLLQNHPDRVLGSFHVDPNAGMEGVRDLERAVETFGVVAATAFPAGYAPQVPISDKKLYPLYAKCVELGIPIFINAGVPGPRFPMAAQDVALLDEVCWFFPELTIVTRHGCEPWTDLAVKLMVKYPNLYYSTSAFAPKHYPEPIIRYLNSRGREKVMYAGYFPAGLSFSRIFAELDALPLKDEAWEPFLYGNAARVLGLDR